MSKCSILSRFAFQTFCSSFTVTVIVKPTSSGAAQDHFLCVSMLYLCFRFGAESTISMNLKLKSIDRSCRDAESIFTRSTPVRLASLIFILSHGWYIGLVTLLSAFTSCRNSRDTERTSLASGQLCTGTKSFWRMSSTVDVYKSLFQKIYFIFLKTLHETWHKARSMSAVCCFTGLSTISPDTFGSEAETNVHRWLTVAKPSVLHSFS